MTIELMSLAIVTLVSALTPIVARLIPKGLVPETVILLLAGALLGPNLAGFIHIDETIRFLSELGLSFLFLLAGYEIDPKNLTGKQGKHGLITWSLSFVFALGVALGFSFVVGEGFDIFALAIVLTTTALGTILPILKERNLVGTRVGDTVLSYGTWGELGPVIAMALLLTTRKPWLTVVILIGFIALAVFTAVFFSRAGKRAAQNEWKIYCFLTDGANTTSQTFVRLTVFLMVFLVAISSFFDLDIVLGSFAAGFILRYVVPEGNHQLETKIEGIAFGFFIPLFFVVSGANINLAAVGNAPHVLIGFIVLLLIVRALPIFISLGICSESKDMSNGAKATVTFYCTAALPLIVAVTSVAVSSGSMTQDTASTLVCAGAVTIFLMPFLASLSYRVSDVQPILAVQEIAKQPHHFDQIIAEHRKLGKMLHDSEGKQQINVGHNLDFDEVVQFAKDAHAHEDEEVLDRFHQIYLKRQHDFKQRHQAIHDYRMERAQEKHEHRMEHAQEMYEYRMKRAQEIHDSVNDVLNREMPLPDELLDYPEDSPSINESFNPSKISYDHRRHRPTNSRQTKPNHSSGRHER